MRSASKSRQQPTEAIRAFPDSRVHTLRDLEAISFVRLAMGTPLAPHAPDATLQLSDHHVTLYSGNGWQTALAFVQFILAHKVAKSYLSCMPELLVKFLCPVQATLPLPWKHIAPDANALVPKPFNAMPPRGNMYVVARLEQKLIAVTVARKADDEPTVSYSYVLSFSGGIYNFQRSFEGKAIPVTLIPTQHNTEQSTCARYLQLNPDMTSMSHGATGCVAGSAGTLCEHGREGRSDGRLPVRSAFHFSRRGLRNEFLALTAGHPRMPYVIFTC